MDGSGAVAVNPLEQLRGAPPKITREPVTGRVTKVDPDGVWVVPLGGDMRVPVGPCRGTAAVDDVCLIVWTQEQAWAISETVPDGGGGDIEVQDLTLLFENGLI